ncbi:putative hydrolase YxeP [Propionispora sp. 2/2-37]|uniref:amidohydrolase n=1 Tax=Propionispora sp. 2/2-37 TaxID=1677858 RepID=UPI0006BB8038|nr:amidohydrolase [Propionispora sp. 2/2-37]CUH94729.1 putative hydrolase YxeP [Propionispora sp. 2/2-37]
MENERLLKVMQRLEEELITVYRKFHQLPELSNEEFQTTKTLRELLTAVGIRILDLPLATGLVAEIAGDTKGPVVAIRCDIDALPVQEETGLPYQSLNQGKMHACGHDFHMTVILGAAYLLRQRERALAGTVKIIFQPAEETGHGAEAIMQTGVLSDVQAIFGLHSQPHLPVGTIGTCTGPLTAAVDRFELDIIGVGTHAAEPDKGIDPIVVAAHVVTALQTIVSRNINAFDQGLVSVTHIKSGNTWNVIPQSAFLEGTVRTLKAETRKLIPAKIKQISEGIAASFGARAELRWYPGPPATNNTAKWAKLAAQVGEETGYEVREEIPWLGGEDFAYYQEKMPGAFINVGTGQSYAHHHPKFSIDEAAILHSARYFSRLAEQVLLALEKDI